ncbi:MAG: FAD-dependent oxidoreductase [Gammaproteobacteria bacterium]|nr:FAD-dependent oxidoreductase [Gammaproteobacteria bacterium]
MLLLEAARCGQRAVLLEQRDFGAGTSFNSLRIIHGGLRYLQSIDLPRFFESVAERRWFLKAFPDLVRPLPCIMPIYNRGIRRMPLLRSALWVNDLLSAKRNTGVSQACCLPDGRMLSPHETQALFPAVRMTGLSGAACWYDAHMPDSQRVIMGTLRWACALGAQAFNYVAVERVIKRGGAIAGVEAIDQETGQKYEFRAETVINATGPSARAFAARSDKDVPGLFRPSLAWNVLFDCPAPSEYALALTPDRPGAHTYFLHPWKGRLLAGTGHQPWGRGLDEPAPDDAQMERFVADLNDVLPQAGLHAGNVVRVYSGFLPVEQAGGTKLSDRSVMHDHGRNGGPQGLYSVSGVKFTMARKEAERTMNCIVKERRLGKMPPLDPQSRPLPNNPVASVDYEWMPPDSDSSWKKHLAALIKEESVIHLDDLVLRRTSIGDNPRRARRLATQIADVFDWDEQRREQELSRLLQQLT